MAKASSKYFILSNALHLLAVAATLYILVIIPLKLDNVHLQLNDNLTSSHPASTNGTTSNYGPVAVQSKCLLDPGTVSNTLSGPQFCVALIVFAIVSLIFGAVVSLVQCCCSCITAGALKLSHLVTVLGDLILAVAWGLLFATLLPRANAASKAGFPQHGFRQGVEVAAGVALVSFILDAIVNLFGICTSVGR